MLATDPSRQTDELLEELGLAHAEMSDLAMVGGGWYELRDESRRTNGVGALVGAGWFENLITDVGDQFYGERATFTTSPNQFFGTATTAITAITNATSAVVSATAHGLSVGDIVRIAGVTPAGCNGDWAITAVTANTFTIYVGTALGAGSVFGTCQGLKNPRAAGMKLGTGNTAVAKNGAGAALVTYQSGSQQAFDAAFPTSASSSGRRIQYKVTYAAGTATANGLNEVVIVNENVLADATTAAANTISRALLSPIVNKGASDSLAVTWSHTLLGA